MPHHNLVGYLGKYRGNADSEKHQNGEPSKHHGEGCAAFHFADAGDADGGQHQRPNGKDVKRGQEATQH